MRSSAWSLGIALAGVFSAAILALAATAIAFNPPFKDLSVMAAAMLGTGMAGIVFALGIPRLARSLGLRERLTLFALVALLIVVANIGVAAFLMFLSGHDLKLLFILCAFAFLASLGPAHLMGRSVSARIERLQSAATALAGGRLGTRIGSAHGDDIARLERDFDQMAAGLEEATIQRDSLEAARRDLFASISHDLRTPLASIRVMVEALSDGVVSDEATSTRYLRTISSEIQRLSALIDDLFELTTIESGELRLNLETLLVEDLVAEAIDIFRPQTERAGIVLRFEPGGPTPPVRADAQRLNRVLCNLLQNAIRHTPGDGIIVLRTAATPGAVQVAIEDTGEGIPASDFARIFDRFYRGDKARSRDGGSGLGLSIARGIVEAHGGRIWVQPTPGSGATFAFTLPVN